MGLEVTNSDEQTFALYRPTSFTHSCFVSHPDEIFETSSMSCLPPPKTGYQLNLCSQTILRGFLTNAQLEAISLACAQHDLRLHVLLTLTRRLQVQLHVLPVVQQPGEESIDVHFRNDRANHLAILH